MTDRIVLAARRVFTGDTVWEPGWVVVEYGVVTDAGAGAVAEPGSLEFDTITPGHVDIHAHGAAGFDFGTASPAEVETIIGFHAARGTTALMASLATAPPRVLEERISALRPFVESGELLGIHLEGPYLSPTRRGAHTESLLRLPNLDEVQRLIDAGGGTVRMLTIAPELPGAEPVIRWLVDAGVTVAIGHSDADATTARAAINWGATVVTHLFNGMRPLHHRDPGLVGVALADERVTLELIVDGHHVDAVVSEVVLRAASARLALVSDAMSATGCSDGDYAIGGAAVRVNGGVAMLADGSSLAGSTITVADAAHALMALPGAQLADVVRAASTTPARAVGGTTSAGRIAIGAPADLLAFGPSAVDAAAVANPPVEKTAPRVMRRGRWLPSL